MQIKFWGVRGSIPVSGPTTLRFGGNTACVSVEVENGDLFILDAGTGIRALGQELMARGAPCKAVLLLSHGHWDHIQGFPFFGPAYQNGTQMDIMGFPAGTHRLRHVLSDVMERTHFPVPLDGLSAQLTFHTMSDGWHKFSKARLRSIKTCHPGGGHGFRIEADGRVLVYLTDNELPGEGPDRERFVQAIRDANVLIHDAQYTEEEMPRYKGWGHSSVEDAVRLAQEAGVETLFLFHHDPDRSDDQLSLLEKQARHLCAHNGGRLHVSAAAEHHTLLV